MPTVAQSRRHEAAVVSIDVVGYSAMMAADPDGTVETLAIAHGHVVAPGILAHRGRLIGRAGDSWLVEFADADAALAFALEVQRGVAATEPARTSSAPMRLRIGIDWGDIIESDDTLHGTGIIVAVRLQGIARSGGINLSAALRKRLRAPAGCTFREIGPRLVKNLPEPVWVYRAQMPGDDAEPQPPAGPEDAALPSFEDRPAIAVLPLRPAGRVANEDHVCESLAEDIIAGLCRLRWFPVIASASTFRHRDEDESWRDLGVRLGARYLVGGSLYRTGRLVRINMWLARTDDGHMLWTERYEFPATEMAVQQDEIARDVVAAIEPAFSRAEQFRSRKAALETLDTWELVRRGAWHLNRLTRQDSALARDLFDRALLANPNSIEALIHLAWWHFWDAWVRRGPTENWVEMERLARRAMMLDGRDARAVLLVGIAEFMQGDAEHGRAMLRFAVQLNPSLAVAHASIGSTHILAGEPEMAIEPLRTALRLSPDDFYIFHTLGELAIAHAMTGDDAHAVAAAERSLAARPGYLYAHVVRIGALARLNRTGDAQAALAQMLSYRPDFRMRDIEWVPFLDRHWVTFLVEGLRLAGFDDLRTAVELLNTPAERPPLVRAHAP